MQGKIIILVIKADNDKSLIFLFKIVDFVTNVPAIPKNFLVWRGLCFAIPLIGRKNYLPYHYSRTIYAPELKRSVVYIDALGAFSV